MVLELIFLLFYYIHLLLLLLFLGISGNSSTRGSGYSSSSFN